MTSRQCTHIFKNLTQCTNGTNIDSKMPKCAKHRKAVGHMPCQICNGPCFSTNKYGVCCKCHNKRLREMASQLAQDMKNAPAHIMKQPGAIPKIGADMTMRFD